MSGVSFANQWDEDVRSFADETLALMHGAKNDLAALTLSPASSNRP
jgi:hypothetical protein